jgi:2-desacetyl-2-hydroxyethyl bacteriochlorophyllide A dehydrogenase
MSFKQAVLKEPGLVEIHQKESVRKLADNEILLKVHRVGICGSDIHMYLGKHPFANTYPMVQGHEYGGEVIEVGSAVTMFKPGMKATARPQLTCGECPPCKRGNYNICHNLKVEGCAGPEGAAQEYYIIPENRAVTIPDSLTYEEVAMIEPVAVGAHATRRCGSLIGKNVVVMGAGTIGNLVAQFAVFRGAKKVLITDLHDSKLEIALQCSNTLHTANLRNETLNDAVKRVFGNEGFQVAFEATGVQNALTDVISGCENGGTVVIIGVYAQNPVINMGFLGEHELNVIGSMMYLHEDYLETVQLLAEKIIKTAPMVTHHFTLDQYQQAYQFVKGNEDKVVKIMIDVTS